MQLRRSLDVRVQGDDPPRPVRSFQNVHLPATVAKDVIKHGYSTPTPIQAQALPAALMGRDVLGIAKTGSGKTAAFLLPMMVHVLDQDFLAEKEGPIGLVLAPTRELCQQVGCWWLVLGAWLTTKTDSEANPILGFWVSCLLLVAGCLLLLARCCLPSQRRYSLLLPPSLPPSLPTPIHPPLLRVSLTHSFSLPPSHTLTRSLDLFPSSPFAFIVRGCLPITHPPIHTHTHTHTHRFL
jgi:hypothetical protein